MPPRLVSGKDVSLTQILGVPDTPKICVVVVGVVVVGGGGGGGECFGEPLNSIYANSRSTAPWRRYLVQ